MTQPTQKLPSVYTTPGTNTPPQASTCSPNAGQLSKQAPDDVQCLADRARQPGTTTTIRPGALLCPTRHKGMTMSHEPRWKGLRGARITP